MNQAAAKATRREIRRAFGPQAVSAISETQQNTQATVQSVAFAHERIDALVKDLGLSYDQQRDEHVVMARVKDGLAHQRIEELVQRVKDESILAYKLARENSEQLRRGFWGRLRWLLTGR